MSAKVTSLEGKTPRPAPQREVVSVETSDIFQPRSFERYNPDALAHRKGGLGIYARMVQDEQVKAALNFKVLSIIGRGFQFAFDETDLSEDEQKARVCVMNAMTQRMKGSFTDALIAVLRAYRFGYSLTEIVTDTITVEGKAYVGINKLLPRDVSAFLFYTDNYGELLRLTQKVGAQETDLDISRFIHYVQNAEEDPYYGQSELRAAYRPWFMKDTAIKFWMQYLERMAGGFAAIELGNSGIQPNSPDYASLQGMLSNMRSTMGVMLPNGVTMELVTPTTTDAYEKAISFHDLAIAKSLLIPNLLGLSHTGQTGTFAQSQTQLDVYFMTIAADTQRLEQAINDQLFAPIASLNWDDGEYPRFRFNHMSTEQLRWIVETFQKMVTGNTVVPTEADEAWLRKLMDAPVRDEDDLPLVTPAQQQAQANAEATLAAKAQPAASNADQSSSSSKEPTDAGGGKTFTADDVAEIVRAEFAKLAPAKQEPQDMSERAAFTRAVARVDFSVIAQRTQTLEADTSQTVAKLAARAVRRLISAERLPELLDQDTADIGELKFDSTDIGKIKAAFRTMLERGWSMGLMQAMDETSKARKQAYSADARTAKFADLRTNASDYFDSNAFRMAGNLTDGMKSIIQQELLSGVRVGTRPEEVASSIYERLIRKGMTTLEAVDAEEPRAEIRDLTEAALQDALNVANVPAYLNTLARTNTFEALNEARYAEFTDPAVADFVDAIEFTAILDDRTTSICTEMDGHIHPTESPVWDKYRPPLHYNCRSVLVAITTLDGWDGVESDPPTVEPQDGF